MKKLLWGTAIAALLLVAFVASIMIASEAGEEIVMVRTYAADGSPRETRLWVVDDGGFAWLRSGTESGWLERIRQNPSVEMERGGQTRRYRAVPVPGDAARDRIHALMREKYGLADRWISFTIPRDGSVAVRLEPEEPAPETRG